MKKIDLHIHTNCSDGKFTPKEIIDMAKKNKVDLISITDHDSVEAYTPELLDYAKDKGVELVNGVEISTKIGKVGIHVLGYDFDLENEELLEVLANSKNARVNYLYDVADKLKQLGYIIDVKKLMMNKVVTKSHIAQDIIDEKKNEDILFETFGEIPSKGNFIETIMNEGCPAYVKKFSISPMEASKVIKKAGGKVVLAHPVAYIYEDNVSIEFMKDLVKMMEADGIEGNYLYVNRFGTLINEIDIWNNVARESGLFVTTGSDFHELDHVHPEIGFKNYGIKFSNVEVEKIKKTR